MLSMNKSQRINQRLSMKQATIKTSFQTSVLQVILVTNIITRQYYKQNRLLKQQGNFLKRQNYKIAYENKGRLWDFLNERWLLYFVFNWFAYF